MMTTRTPAQIAIALAGIGAATLSLLEPSLPVSHFAPAMLGTACATVATWRVLRELRVRDRIAITFGTVVLGFFAGSAGASGPHPWALGWSASWLPTVLFFIGGIGRERRAFELARLENDVDSPEQRPRVLARSRQICDEVRKASYKIDPRGLAEPRNSGDPRAIYAYAAQVAGLALALDGRFGEAAESLAAVPPAWMPAPMRSLMLSNLCHWQLCAGNLEGAQRAVKHAHEKLAPAPARPFVRAARSAVLARSGDPEAALDLIGRHDGQFGEPAAVRQRYRITRAHALAARGDASSAREELHRVVADGGLDELRRWLPAGGPALPTMQELLAAA